MNIEIREYCEGFDVKLTESNNGRLVVRATNQGGYDSTEVDLEDLLIVVKSEMPELWQSI